MKIAERAIIGTHYSAKSTVLLSRARVLLQILLFSVRLGLSSFHSNRFLWPLEATGKLFFLGGGSSPFDLWRLVVLSGVTVPSEVVWVLLSAGSSSTSRRCEATRRNKAAKGIHRFSASNL